MPHDANAFNIFRSAGFITRPFCLWGGVSYLCRLLMLLRHLSGSCDEYGKEKARGVSDFAGFVVSLIQDQTSFLRDSKMQASVMTAAAQR